MSEALSSLVVDEHDLAQRDLAEALRPYVRLTRGGNLLLEPAFDELATELRVVCVLLAFQALHMLGLRETDHAAPAEIAGVSGMPDGTVRPKLSALVKARRVAKHGRRYSLPTHVARRATAMLADARRG